MKPASGPMPNAPNGCAAVSIVDDKVVPRMAWRYVIDLDGWLWVQSISPGEQGPWEVVVKAHPVARTRQSKISTASRE